MTIAENQTKGNNEENKAENQGSPAIKKSFFSNEELDLLDIPEPAQARSAGKGMGMHQTAVIVLILTAVASFALGMLAERSISASSGVVGQGSGAGGAFNTSNAAASNALQTQAPVLPQTTK